jgi:hypothetical protein
MKTLQIQTSTMKNPERLEEYNQNYIQSKLKNKCKQCQLLIKAEKNSLEICSCNDNLCDCCNNRFPYVISLSWDNSRVCTDCARWECCMSCRSWCGSNMCKECRSNFL